MSQRMQALREAVANTRPGVDSTIVFINGIIPMIEAAAGDKTATFGVASDLKAFTGEFASAVGAVPPAIGATPPPPPASLSVAKDQKAQNDARTANQKAQDDARTANQKAENERSASMSRPVPYPAA